jgi:hypothetical protein
MMQRMIRRRAGLALLLMLAATALTFALVAAARDTVAALIVERAAGADGEMIAGDFGQYDPLPVRDLRWPGDAMHPFGRAAHLRHQRQGRKAGCPVWLHPADRRSAPGLMRAGLGRPTPRPQPRPAVAPSRYGVPALLEDQHIVLDSIPEAAIAAEAPVAPALQITTGAACLLVERRRWRGADTIA